jgi:hypothetical protein
MMDNVQKMLLQVIISTKHEFMKSLNQAFLQMLMLILLHVCLQNMSLFLTGTLLYLNV